MAGLVLHTRTAVEPDAEPVELGTSRDITPAIGRISWMNSDTSAIRPSAEALVKSVPLAHSRLRCIVSILKEDNGVKVDMATVFLWLYVNQ